MAMVSQRTHLEDVGRDPDEAVREARLLRQREREPLLVVLGALLPLNVRERELNLPDLLVARKVVAVKHRDHQLLLLELLLGEQQVVEGELALPDRVHGLALGLGARLLAQGWADADLSIRGRHVVRGHAPKRATFDDMHEDLVGNALAHGRLPLPSQTAPKFCCD